MEDVMNRKYTVDVRHARGCTPWEGTHEFEMHDDIGGVYVTSREFGCSRAYKTDDQSAIALLLDEHACTYMRIQAK